MSARVSIKAPGQQVGAVLLDPTAVEVRVRAQPLADRPEAIRMVHLGQMRDFMGGDIVEHLRRGHDQPPGEHQITLRRTTAPPRPGVAQGDAAIGAAQRSCMARHRRSQPLSRKGSQQGLDARSFPWANGHFDATIRETCGPARPFDDLAKLPTDRNASPDLRALNPGCALQMLAHPILPRAQKGQSFRLWRPCRKAKGHPPIGPADPQGKPFRAGIAAHQNLNRGITRQDVG